MLSEARLRTARTEALRYAVASILGCGILLTGTVAHSQEVLGAQVHRCFEIVPPVAGTVPGVLLLIDTCLGDAFILSRTQRRPDQGEGWVWVKLARVDASAAGRAAQSNARPMRKGCFFYDGRQFCP
jgi:hypothetical protein